MEAVKSYLNAAYLNADELRTNLQCAHSATETNEVAMEILLLEMIEQVARIKDRIKRLVEVI